MKKEEAEKILSAAVALVGEHFDAVQLMVSWNEEGQTSALYRGSGNWYARQGMAHEFINQDVAQEHAHQLSRAIPKAPPDEDWKET